MEQEEYAVGDPVRVRSDRVIVGGATMHDNGWIGTVEEVGLIFVWIRVPGRDHLMPYWKHELERR